MEDVALSLLILLVGVVALCVSGTTLLDLAGRRRRADSISFDIRRVELRIGRDQKITRCAR